MKNLLLALFILPLPACSTATVKTPSGWEYSRVDPVWSIRAIQSIEFQDSAGSRLIVSGYKSEQAQGFEVAAKQSELIAKLAMMLSSSSTAKTVDQTNIVE